MRNNTTDKSYTEQEQMSLQEECSTKLNPAGTFVDDYEYIRNAGTLDEHNGRYCVIRISQTVIPVLIFPLSKKAIQVYPISIFLVTQTKQQRETATVQNRNRIRCRCPWTVNTGHSLGTYTESLTQSLLYPLILQVDSLTPIPGNLPRRFKTRK